MQDPRKTLIGAELVTTLLLFHAKPSFSVAIDFGRSQKCIAYVWMNYDYEMNSVW